MSKIIQETIFWKNFKYYCDLNNLKPNNVTKAIGMSNATATDWKNGSVPRKPTLKKIADYFGVPVSALTEDSETVGAIPSPTKNPSPFLTPHETKVMNAYRAHPEMQPAVDKLLGIDIDSPSAGNIAADVAEEAKDFITSQQITSIKQN